MISCLRAHTQTHVCVFVYARARVCVCVCVCDLDSVAGSNQEVASMCVCVCERVSSVLVGEWVGAPRQYGRQQQGSCLCVCV